MRKKRLYLTDYCYTPYEKIQEAGILCADKKIISIGGASAYILEPDLEVIKLPGCYAVPGFVDTHIHGAGGFDSSTAYEKDANIASMCSVLASHGVTSFVPTLVSSPVELMLGSISALGRMLDSEYEGSSPVGIHVEGPFLNREKHGSQRMDDLKEIDLGIAREIILEGKNKIKIMTFAPELEGSEKLIELLLENGIIPSMGHSMADESTVTRAVDAGVTRCTHLFNGMPQLHQRNIALTAVALTDDRISIELILDGEHLHPRIVDLACRCKPKDKIIGVSDSTQGAGMVDGTYHLGTAEINVKDGHVTTGGGVLAGTTLTLEKGWHHLVNYSHMKNTDSAACFTVNPARNIGLENVGELKPGKIADIAFFEATTNKTRLTVSRGRIIYDSEGKLVEHLPDSQP